MTKNGDHGINEKNSLKITEKDGKGDSAKNNPSLLKKAGNGIFESKTAVKVSEQPKTVVLDLRKDGKSADRNARVGAGKNKIKASDSDKGDFLKMVGEQRAEAAPEKVRTAQMSPQNLSSLKQTLPTEIVRQSTFVLRGSDSGEIRLILKPENLGQVKVNVELQDNRVAAKIVVDSQAVREVLEQQMGHLKDQFLEQGFSDASVEVFVRQDSQGKKKEFSQIADNKKVIGEWDRQIPEISSEYYNPDLRINVMA